MRFMNKSSKVERWLRKCCDYSDGPYDNPGYSSHYMSYFNLYDNTGELYSKNDIDSKLNPGYVDDIFGNIEETEEDTLIAKFVDYIPIKPSKELVTTMTFEEYGQRKYDIIEKLSRECIMIPPGTNQCNANYMFKILKEAAQDIDDFEIPYIDANPATPYEGTLKSASITINKEKVYEFVYDNSIHKRPIY